KGLESEVLSHLMGKLQELSHKWNVLQLNEMPRSSPNLEELLRLGKDAGFVTRKTEVACGFMQLPSTWESYLGGLRSRFRTSIRAGLRNMEQWEGGFDLLENAEEVDEWLNILFSLHSGRWALKDQSGIFASDAKRHFYRHLTRTLLERGWLCFTRWRAKSAVLACQFGFIYNNTYHLLQEGFDEQCTHIGPGVTLRAASMQHVIASGVGAYDFLGGIGRHKTDWLAEEKYSCRIMLAKSGVASLVCVALPEKLDAAKTAAKRLLPAKLLDQ